MPADLVTGQDAEDVATYIASVAGTGAAPPDFTPAEIFANQGCAGCHTLEAAGTTATTGPDLDEALAGQTKAQVTKSIVNPSANLTPGFQNAMPATVGTSIPADDLRALVRYLLKSTGGE
jgi:mono/diheme cytochrome c family protein